MASIELLGDRLTIERCTSHERRGKLHAVVTQNLVKTADGRGRRAVLEVLVMTRAIAKLIMTEQTHQIPAQLQTGKSLGMQTMDQSLLDAMNQKLIDPDDAYRYATDNKKFERFVTDTTILPSGAVNVG